jgi:hypothetical protein
MTKILEIRCRSSSFPTPLGVWRGSRTGRHRCASDCRNASAKSNADAGAAVIAPLVGHLASREADAGMARFPPAMGTPVRGRSALAAYGGRAPGAHFQPEVDRCSIRSVSLDASSFLHDTLE